MMQGTGLKNDAGKKLIDRMVDRFLCWALPEDFAPDCGISFTPFHPNGTTRFEPVGTNLLTAIQARQMFEHALGADENRLDDVKAAIHELMAETIYEDGKMANGISVRFLARMTMLRVAAGLVSPDDPLAVESRELLGEG
jgi:hypothetical protein